MRKKKILIVSYGGGHIEIVKSIINDCIDFEKFDVDLLALTVAYDSVNSPRICKYRVSDFKFLFEDAIPEIEFWGKKLLKDNYDSSSNIPINEIIFYLGISFYDLVNEMGEELATQTYKIKKRQSFNPKNTLKVILKHLKPDFLFTTNSPRMESASIYAAKELHIPSIQILDLFGDDFPVPSADTIIVMNEFVRGKLLDNGITKKILPLGQPIFDETFQKVCDINKLNVLKKLGYNVNDRILLFCPTPYYLWNDDNSINGIEDESKINIPIFNILFNLNFKYGIKIILRPHPISDSISNYKKYLDKYKFIKYHNNNDLNLYESLAISEVVITYNSTVAVQAIICNKTVFTYNYDANQRYLWDNFMKEPFIYCHNYDKLNLKLDEYYSHKLEKTNKILFYELGAKLRINDYFNYVLWNS
jgi:hypothetical protein